MGKTTGFLEYERIEESRLPVAQRLKSYREFVITLDDSQAQIQGARCMDCGTPFCHSGCPLGNIIPDFNDLMYRQDWHAALDVLHSTNNFPEFTGRICPAPCEAACVLNIHNVPVGIKSIEHAIIDHGWDRGWIQPQPAAHRSGKKVAIVGSGPAGLAAAQQLARAGHSVTVFEKNERVGGLLRYGIPDFKLDKCHIDCRATQLQAEGVVFRTGVLVADRNDPGTQGKVASGAQQIIPPAELMAQFDAVLLAGGAEQSRDLPIPGRDLGGVHFAMEFLTQQNRANAGSAQAQTIHAAGKHVVVIGGGDTGSDCVGTSNRHGAASVTQLELLPMPPRQEDKSLTWPYWPLKLRTSSSHDEGCQREFAIVTKEFTGSGGRLTGLKTARVQWQDGRMSEIPGSEQVIPADLVFLALGFTGPVQTVLDAFGVEKDARGNALASTCPDINSYATSVPRLFAAGDMRRGQSLVVWAIREGREAALAIDRFLMA